MEPDIAQFIKKVRSDVELMSSQLQRVPDGLIDLPLFEQRSKFINMVKRLYSDLHGLTQFISKIGANIESTHNTEVAKAQDALARVRCLAQSSELPKPAERPLWASVATLPRLPQPPPSPSNMQMVSIAPDVLINAIVVSQTLTASEIRSSITAGQLHYIPQWKHFAVKIGECVFHAGLGTIYPNIFIRRQQPSKISMLRIKPCYRQNCRGTAGGCTYYHNPEVFPNSTDVRNYVADSWMYMSIEDSAYDGARRIGNGPTIMSDIAVIGADDEDRFYSQVAHDILCALILWQRKH